MYLQDVSSALMSDFPSPRTIYASEPQNSLEVGCLHVCEALTVSCAVQFIVHVLCFPVYECTSVLVVIYSSTFCFQCHHHSEILEKLDSLATAVGEINKSVHQCLSRLADIEVVVSTGVPCNWSLPRNLPPAFSTQPLHPSIQQQSLSLSSHIPPSLNILSSTPSSSKQLVHTPSQEPVPCTPCSANSLHQSSNILSPIPSGPQQFLSNPTQRTPHSAHTNHQPSPSILSPIPSAGVTTPAQDSTNSAPSIRSCVSSL